MNRRIRISFLVSDCMTTCRGNHSYTTKGDKAYYNPLLDFINMPAKNLFPKVEDYYSVLFHEIHSTGHLTRLNRKELLQMSEFGSESYSIEELVAEIGCCFLKTVVGISNDELTNNCAYIDGWLKRLKSDHRFIVYAS
jgi:antirestriction protein ArdC